MSQQPGWYDDPQDSEVLRYWDGVQWTSHTSPRQRPNMNQTQQARMNESLGEGGASQPSGHGGYGSYPIYQPAPGGDHDLADGAVRTPDGQRVSGWWRRLFARLVDGILLGLLTVVLLPFIAPDFTDSMERLLNLITESTTTAELEDSDYTAAINDVTAQSVRIGLASTVLSLLYEAVFLKVAAATPGKLLLGLRVRLREQPGPLGWSTSGIRSLTWFGPGLLAAVPSVGFIGSVFQLLNGLWPLWDSNKQSLNDKVAKTNVVRKR